MNGPVAQRIRRLTTDQKIPGSNPGRVGLVLNFFFLFLALFFTCTHVHVQIYVHVHVSFLLNLPHPWLGFLFLSFLLLILQSLLHAYQNHNDPK